MESAKKTIGKYEISDIVLGEGSFGTVYKGFSIEDKKEVAIKHEPYFQKYPQLEHEFIMYKKVHEWQKHATFPRVPKVYDFYEIDLDGRYLVMESLGPNLEELFILCGKKFSLKTTLWIAEKVLDILRRFHFCDHVYVDIKPENFLLGKGINSNKLLVVDLGLMEKCTDAEGNPLPYSEEFCLRGTPIYASISNHFGRTYGPKDDVIATCYMLFRFLLGSLPWENLPDPKKIISMKLVEEKSRLLYENKEIPVEMAIFLEHCSNVSYDRTPRYFYYDELFRTMKQKNKIIDDEELDWKKFIN